MITDSWTNFMKLGSAYFIPLYKIWKMIKQNLVKSEHPLLISYVIFENKNKNNDKNHI